MSDSKPIRWSFLLTIPLVMAATWAVMLTLAHFQRRELVEQLSARVTDGSVSEARAALTQIVRMPTPPLELLVAAAVSPSRRVADRAQAAISEMLRSWQRQLNAKRRSRPIARQVEQLAAVLDDNRAAFSRRDYPWLATTAERLVRLANAAPPQDAPGLADHCESLLALAKRPREGAPMLANTVAIAAELPVPNDVFSAPSRAAMQSIISDDRDSHLADAAEPTVPSTTPEIATAPPLRWSDPSVGQQLPDATPSAPRPPLPLNESDMNDLPSLMKPALPATSPGNAAAIDPWEGIESRTLLERWLTAEGVSQLRLARELEHRGFGKLRSDVVRIVLSEDAPRRVALVQDVLELPGVGAKAWLLLFADDASAEVRLAAVTVMATSKDPELLEKAWQVALHDRDPRIASLAERLRDRRGIAR